MKLRSLATATLLFLLSASGCSCSMPSQDQIDDAKERASAAVKVAEQARLALELLGILPTYECGEPRRTFAGRVVETASADFACVTATAAAEGDSADVVTLAFPEGGCDVRGHSLAGNALYRYSGGEDRMDLEADYRGLKVDGEPLLAKAGYGTCSDEKRVWALAEGEIPKMPGVLFKIDGRVGLREGMPLVGSSSLLLDGSAEITRAEGVDKITFSALLYEVGQYLPKEGSLLIETSGGKRLQVTFDPGLWRLGEAEVVIDDYDPVTIPIVH